MRRLSISFADAATFAVACALSLTAFGSTVTLRSSDGAPVPNAAVALAVESAPGPYEVRWSDRDGRIDIPQFPGVLLIIHPGFVPLESPIAEQITLRKGTAVDVPQHARREGVALRIYSSDWIGRFDVETLPPIYAAAVLSCGSAETVFDVDTPSGIRTVARATIPTPRAGTPATQRVKVRSEPGSDAPGVIFLASGDDHEPAAVPRSRLFRAGSEAVFENVAVGRRYVIIAAMRGQGPVVRSVRVPAVAAPLELVPVVPAQITARLHCEPRVSDLRVRAQWSPFEAVHVSIPRSVTRADDGRLRVDDLAPGRVELSATAPGHRDATRTILLAEDRRSADAGSLCPAPPWRIRGIVLNEDRKPLRNVAVRYASAAVTTKRDGTFAVSVTAPSEAELSAALDGYVTWRRWFEPTEGDATVRIELSRGTRYTGRVLDAATHEPVTRFRLRLLTFVDRPERVFDRWMTSADGSFSTTPLRQDVTRVIVETDSHQLSAVELETASDAIRDLGTIELQPLLRITGRVFDEDGVPLEATVRARSETLSDWNRGMSGTTLFEGITDANGDFDLRVRSGTYTVSARATAMTPHIRDGVEVSGDVDLGTIHLGTGCDLRVRALRRRQPVPQTPVALHRGTVDDQRDVVTQTTDDDGWASFHGLGSGEYTAAIRIGHRLGASRSIAFDEKVCDDETSLELELSGVVVQGFARRGGLALANEFITLFPISEEDSPRLTIMRQRISAEGRTEVEELLGKGAHEILTTSDATGFFMFEDVRAGAYRLTGWQGAASRSRRIVIPDVMRFDATTDFDSPMITGDVADGETSEPIVGAHIVIENAAGATIQSTMSSDSGGFELSGGSEEAVRLRVTHPEYAASSQALSPEMTMLRLEMKRVDSTFRGQVAPAADAVIHWQLETTAGPFLGSTFAKSDGRFEIARLKAGTLIVAASSTAGGAIASFDLSAAAEHEQTISLEQDSTVRVLLPDEARPEELRISVNGIDITPLLWRVAAFQPRPGAASEWVWRLPQGPYGFMLRRETKRLTLYAGVNHITFRP